MQLKHFNVWCGFVVFVATGCAPAAGDRLSRDIARLERDIADLRAFQAEQTTRIAAAQAETRALFGRLEEVERIATQGRPGETSSQELIEAQLPAVVPAEALRNDEQFLSALPGNVRGPFGDGLSSIRGGDFSGAIPRLERALDLSAGQAFLPNILFWLGIAHEGLGDDGRALSAYHDFTTRFSRHELASQALLRQSLLFTRLGDSSAARLTLQKLVAEYPDSREATIARERLRNL
jgi:TolA-binding protein